jgi:hypothetical protein
MTQAFGFILMLVGAIMFHIAAGTTSASTIQDVWVDMLKTMKGQLV